MIFRIFERYQTQIFATIIALVMITAGIFLPSLLPDQLTYAPPGFEDSTWIKTMVTVLFIGMGLLSFFWIVVIQWFLRKKSKKDYMY